MRGAEKEVSGYFMSRAAQYSDLELNLLIDKLGPGPEAGGLGHAIMVGLRAKPLRSRSGHTFRIVTGSFDADFGKELL